MSAPSQVGARSPRLPCAGLAESALALLLVAVGSAAQAFGLGVSPPRFELAAAAGQVLREIVDLSHSSREAQSLSVSTADWGLDEGGGLQLQDALQPGSCRPWVAIERAELQLPPDRKMRYRFETRVPADAAPGECRYALVFQSLASAGSDARPFDVLGRMAVIVYVRIGAAQPELVVERVVADPGQGHLQLAVRNTGNATGRLGGRVSGVRSDGQVVELEPMTVPVLPGKTRLIGLRPPDAGAAAESPAAAAPWRRLHGELKIEGVSRKLALDMTVGP